MPGATICRCGVMLAPMLGVCTLLNQESLCSLTIALEFVTTKKLVPFREEVNVFVYCFGVR